MQMEKVTSLCLPYHAAEPQPLSFQPTTDSGLGAPFDQDVTSLSSIDWLEPRGS